MIRFIIDSATQGIGFLKKNRRIRPKAPEGTPNVKINLGCGLSIAKGWINVDGSLNALVASWPRIAHKLLYWFSGSNRYYSLDEYCSLLANHSFVHHNLVYGIPFVDQSVDYVYSSHFLEHLFKDEARHLIRESYRVLKPGGLIRICVPDLEHAILLYGRGETEKMLKNYFFVEDKRSFYARHKYMYDFNLLKDILDQTGFKDVIRCGYKQGKTPDLEILDNRPEETLYIEAVAGY